MDRSPEIPALIFITPLLPPLKKIRFDLERV